MHTNIEHDDAVHLIAQALNDGMDIEYPIPRPSTESLVKLFEILIMRNIFVFDSQTHIQTCGLAMGSRCSCSASDIVIYAYAKKLVTNRPACLKCFFRFRDDVFFIWAGPKADLDLFKNRANNMHHKI